MFGNIIGQDPLFNNPEDLDFSLQPGSPAAGYGCRIFGRQKQKELSQAVKVYRKPLKTREIWEFSGEITEDTFWTADTILITGNVSIMPDVHLQIDAGCRIEFTDYYNITVLGSVSAGGTPDDRITFTSSDAENFSFNAGHRGSWNGIKFPFTSPLQDSSFFSYCNFEYAKQTLDDSQAGAVFSLQYFSKLKVENCLFRHNLADRGGVFACRNMSAPFIVNCLLYDNYCLNTGSVFYNEYSYPILVNNTITENISLNEDIWSPSCTVTNYFSKPKLYNNIIWDNSTLYFLPAEIFEPKPVYYSINDIDQEGLNPDNLYTDPQMNTDYGLSTGSICVDAGNIPPGGVLPELDLNGNPRISGSDIDLGCLEFQNPSSTDNLVSASSLLSIFPNPFNPVVNLSYFLNDTAETEFTVFNIKGEEIYRRQYISNTGQNSLFWKGSNSDGYPVSSGLYFFRVKTDTVEYFTKGCLVK